jgi:hypothetical protein
LSRRPPRRSLVLALGLAAIVVWQAGFALFPRNVPRTHRLTAAKGIWAVSSFVYFYYYLGLYPVAADGQREFDYSEEGARRLLAEAGPRLVMDWLWTFRGGERGRVLLFLPDALLKGAPRAPSARPSHALVFTAALAALFTAFWTMGRPLLGASMVALLGSNPFQLFEVYVNGNVFGWPISTAILVLAVNLPLLGDGPPSRRALWLAPLVTGALVATVRTVRMEPVVILASAAGAYLTIGGVGWRRRAVALGVFAAALAATTVAWDAYFTAKFREARRVVAAAGGRPLPADHVPLSHPVWHNVWCGLGDFDTVYGHAWDDRVAFAFALPILRREYGIDPGPLAPGKYFLADAYWDEARTYAKLPDELPHYGEVMRRDVLAAIARNPGWYLGILARRAWRVVAESTPVRLALGPWQVTVPFHGLVVLPVVAALVATRRWMLLKVALFLVPLTLPALLVYSGDGMAFYTCHHLAAAAIVVSVAGENLHARRVASLAPERPAA